MRSSEMQRREKKPNSQDLIKNIINVKNVPKFFKLLGINFQLAQSHSYCVIFIFPSQKSINIYIMFTWIEISSPACVCVCVSLLQDLQGRQVQQSEKKESFV